MDTNPVQKLSDFVEKNFDADEMFKLLENFNDVVDQHKFYMKCLHDKSLDNDSKAKVFFSHFTYLMHFISAHQKIFEKSFTQEFKDICAEMRQESAKITQEDKIRIMENNPVLKRYFKD